MKNFAKKEEEIVVHGASCVYQTKIVKSSKNGTVVFKCSNSIVLLFFPFFF